MPIVNGERLAINAKRNVRRGTNQCSKMKQYLYMALKETYAALVGANGTHRQKLYSTSDTVVSQVTNS